MKRKEAEILCETLANLSDEQRENLISSGAMNSNIIKHWEAGYIQSFAKGCAILSQGIEITNPAFNHNPTYYKVIKPEIDWAKALKHGAWGQEFMFKDVGDVDWVGPCELQGYEPEVRGYPFRAGGTNWSQCKPVEGFGVPKEWLKD